MTFAASVLRDACIWPPPFKQPIIKEYCIHGAMEHFCSLMPAS